MRTVRAICAYGEASRFVNCQLTHEGVEAAVGEDAVQRLRPKLITCCAGRDAKSCAKCSVL